MRTPRPFLVPAILAGLRLALAKILLEAEKDGAANDGRARRVAALAEKSRKGP